MKIDTNEIIEIIQTKREYLYNIKCIIIIHVCIHIEQNTNRKKQNKNKKDPYKFEHFLSIKKAKRKKIT